MYIRYTLIFFSCAQPGSVNDNLMKPPAAWAYVRAKRAFNCSGSQPNTVRMAAVNSGFAPMVHRENVAKRTLEDTHCFLSTVSSDVPTFADRDARHFECSSDSKLEHWRRAFQATAQE